MRYGSVCSGIEAASCAWHPLGWNPAWFAEIEAFPSAVLAHHYPDVPNVGDMTQIAGAIEAGALEAPDVLVGGTPCQAFSVAGLRMSLADARGNLSLAFVELANAIDDLRRNRGERPAVIVWENVPGVLNTSDNAFGCFVGGLAGCDTPIHSPPRRGWTDAGVVLGPRRAVAWRVLDAQYFGLAQRRRRVFVVASARDGFDPATVLFEWDGVRRDSPPSREAGENATGSAGAGAAIGFQSSQSGVRLGDTHATLDANNGSRRHNGVIHADPIACCVTASEAKRQDLETCNFVAHTLKAEGFDASEDGTGRGTPLVPVAAPMRFRCNECGHAFNVKHAAGVGGLAPAECPLCGEEENIDDWMPVRGVIPYDLFQVTAPVNRQNRDATSPCHTLARDNAAHAAIVQPIAFPANLSGTQCASTENLAPAMGATNPTAVSAGMQVRRLTPRECERLQGFPDDYTLIPWRTWQEAQRKGSSYESLLLSRGMALRGPSIEECPDGPRYKALGNSMAVPVMRWIGARIARQVTP